ncbi:hypothetical protein WA556_000774, partial [Blastocystis sp. ATCC 50177/Nand II]
MEGQTTRKRQLASDLFSGFVSGVCCKIVEHPFDTIKVLMQVNGNEVYRNSFDCLKKTVRAHGIRGLYRGIQFPLVGSVAENGLTFVSYGFFKRLVGVTSPDRMTFSQMLLSSMGSGMTISFLLTPVELLKCRLQIEQSCKATTKSTTFGVIRHAVQKDGILSLFRGLSMTLLREIPGTSIWFMTYEMCLKPFIRHGYTRSTIPMSGIISAGSISGFLYWVIIYPIDTMKSIIQTDEHYAAQVSGKGMQRYSMMSKYIAKTIGRIGIKGLYGGLSFTILRAVPANAVLFLSYEYASRFYAHF